MADRTRIISAVVARMRHAAFWRRDGIGLRVSLSMTAALVLVVLLVGVFFYLEGRKALENEIKNRALSVAKELAALATDDFIAGNQKALDQKVPFPFMTSEESLSGSALQYPLIYNHTCELLIGSTDTEVFFGRSCFYSLPSVNGTSRDQVPFARNLQQTLARFSSPKRTALMISPFLYCPGTSGSVFGEVRAYGELPNDSA